MANPTLMVTTPLLHEFSDGKMSSILSPGIAKMFVVLCWSDDLLFCEWPSYDGDNYDFDGLVAIVVAFTSPEARQRSLYQQVLLPPKYL